MQFHFQQGMHTFYNVVVVLSTERELAAVASQSFIYTALVNE